MLPFLIFNLRAVTLNRRASSFLPRISLTTQNAITNGFQHNTQQMSQKSVSKFRVGEIRREEPTGFGVK